MHEKAICAGAPSPRAWLWWSGLLVAAYLVVGFIGWRRSLIITEVWALYYAERPVSEQLQAIRADLVHPPLIYIVQRLWLGVFGHTDNSAKALALVINLPTFFLFTWLATRVTPHWRLASFLLASVYLSIGGTLNLVRMYGLGLLLTVSAMVLWEKWCESRRNETLLAWTVVAVLLIYTHLFGATLLLAFVAANWLLGLRRWAFTGAAVVAGILFLPWFLYVLPVYRLQGLGENLVWVPKKWSVNLAGLSYGLLGGVLAIPSEVRMILKFVAAILHLVLLIWAVPVARRLWRQRDMNPAARWFWSAALLVGVPILLVVLVSIAVYPALQLRFLIGIIPAYWLLVVLVCQESGRPGRAFLYGVLLVWVMANIAVGFVLSNGPSPVREVALVVAREQRPDDLVLCSPGTGNQFYWELTHGLGRSARIEVLRPPIPVFRRLLVPPQIDPESIQLDGVNRIWFLYSEGEETRPDFESLRARGFVLQKEFPGPWITLLLFARSAGTLNKIALTAHGCVCDIFPGIEGEQITLDRLSTVIFRPGLGDEPYPLA